MFKQFAASLALVVLVHDSTQAHNISPSMQLLRVSDDRRVLEMASPTSTDNVLANPLYEANVSIKGCRWYDYFLPWSCCGANNC